MKIRFTIGRRIGLGFASFIIFTSIAFILTVVISNDSKKKTIVMVDQVSPSVAELKQLNLMLQRSHTDISKWYYNSSFNDVEFRKELENIIKVEWPQSRAKLSNLAKQWEKKEEIDQLHTIFNLGFILTVLNKNY